MAPRELTGKVTSERAHTSAEAPRALTGTERPATGRESADGSEPTQPPSPRSSLPTPARLLRLLLLPPLAGLLASLGVFALAAISPANPLANSVARWESTSAGAREQLGAAYRTFGWIGAWAEWLGGILTGQGLGRSRSANQAVLDVLAQRGAATLLVTCLAALLVAAIMLLAATAMIRWPRLATGRTITVTTSMWLAMPSFLIAVLVVLIAGPILPSSVRSAPAELAPGVAAVVALAWLPALLAAARSAAAEVWATPWARALIGRGLPLREVRRILMPKILAPVLSYAVLLIPQIILGEAAIEAVMAYPGLGSALVTAAAEADLPLLAAVTALAAATTALALQLLPRTPVIVG